MKLQIVFTEFLTFSCAIVYNHQLASAGYNTTTSTSSSDGSGGFNLSEFITRFRYPMMALTVVFAVVGGLVGAVEDPTRAFWWASFAWLVIAALFLVRGLR